MGLEASPEPGLYVEQLMHHAGQLQREAGAAMAQGDYARAAALINDAEMLADDVGELVDAIEKSPTSAFLLLATKQQAAAAARRKPRWPGFALPSRRVSVALGASVAMSLALAEC